MEWDGGLRDGSASTAVVDRDRMVYMICSCLFMKRVFRLIGWIPGAFDTKQFGYVISIIWMENSQSV